MVIRFILGMFGSRLFMPVLVSMLLGGLYTAGYVKGNNACKAKIEQINQKEVKKYDKIKQNINSIDHDSLVKRLRKFTRD